MLKKLFKTKSKQVVNMVYQRYDDDFMSVSFAVRLPKPSQLEKAIHALALGKKKVPGVQAHVGFAVQSPKDPFNKKVARKVAQERLVELEMEVMTVRYENNDTRVGEVTLVSADRLTGFKIRFYADNPRLYRVAGVMSRVADECYLLAKLRNKNVIEKKKAKRKVNADRRLAGQFQEQQSLDQSNTCPPGGCEGCQGC